MTILAPLTIPVEKYVVVDIIDGVAQTDLLHLPANTRLYSAYGEKRRQRIRFADRIEQGFPPASWPAACGAFQTGSIYIQAGPLADKPVCETCTSGGKAHRPRSTARPSHSLAVVLQLLASGPLTVKEIAELRGSSENAAAVAISRLKNDGHVHKIGDSYARTEEAA